MKLFLSTILFSLVSVLLVNSAYSLSDYEIQKLCQNKKIRTNCIKNLRLKRYQLLQGNRIEIPVVPFKK